MLRSITRLGIALLNFSQALLALLGNHVDGAQLLSVLILFWLFVIHVLRKFPDAVSVNVSKQQFRCRAHTRTTQAHPLQRRKNGWSSVRGEWPPCCATYDRPSEGVGVLPVLRKPKIEKFKVCIPPKIYLRKDCAARCTAIAHEPVGSTTSPNTHAGWSCVLEGPVRVLQTITTGGTQSPRPALFALSSGRLSNLRQKSTRILKSARFLLLSERTFHLASSSNCFIAERVFR
jgi:hypothetical protein